MAHALLVEDDVFSSVILQEILMGAGHSVRLVYDGAAALNLVDSDQAFQIAVVDLLLPGNLGFEVIKALRRKSKTVAIIAVGGAGAGDASLNQSAVAVGANLALSKPISRTDLSRHLTELLKA